MKRSTEPTVCIGPAPGFACEDLAPAERGRTRCVNCRITHDVAHRLGRPVASCSTCGGTFVLRPGKTFCLDCEERSVFGDRATAVLSPARDGVMAVLLARIDAGEIVPAEAVAELAKYDAGGATRPEGVTAQ